MNDLIELRTKDKVNGFIKMNDIIDEDTLSLVSIAYMRPVLKSLFYLTDTEKDLFYGTLSTIEVSNIYYFFNLKGKKFNS